MGAFTENPCRDFEMRSTIKQLARDDFRSRTTTRAHAHTSGDTGCCCFFFFKLSILIEWEEGDILLYVHLSNSLITWDYEGLTATSN